MKKLLVVFAVSIILLSATSCSSGDSQTSSEEVSSPAQSESKTAEDIIAENQKLLDEMQPIKEEILAYIPQIIPADNVADLSQIDVTVSARDVFGAYIPLDAKTDDLEQIKSIIGKIWDDLAASEYAFDQISFEVYNGDALWGIISRSDADTEYSIMKDGEISSSPIG